VSIISATNFLNYSIFSQFCFLIINGTWIPIMDIMLWITLVFFTLHTLNILQQNNVVFKYLLLENLDLKVFERKMFRLWLVHNDQVSVGVFIWLCIFLLELCFCIKISLIVENTFHLMVDHKLLNTFYVIWLVLLIYKHHQFQIIDNFNNQT